MRPRYQSGHLKLVGKRPSWVGFYYETIKGENGETRRIHRSVRLGLKSEVSRTQAKLKLQEKLSRFQNILPDASVPLKFFIEQKWLPLRQAKWKKSTALTSMGMIKKQILEPLGAIPLRDFDRPMLQQHLNSLATAEYSQSICGHTLSFLKHIFDTALDLDFIVKDPARRLELPRTFPVRINEPENAVYSGKPYLSIAQLRKLLAMMEGRNRLITQFASLMAMRPSEIFALQWKAYSDENLTIFSRIYRNKFDVPKTPASTAQLPVPKVIREGLERLRPVDCNPHGFIFQGHNPKYPHSPMCQYHFSETVLKPTGILAVGTLFPVTFQVLRRTWSTHAVNYGATLKEIEVVLRHSASLNFTTGTYIQGMRERVLTALDGFANAVCEGLPEFAELPIEKEGFGHKSSQSVVMPETLKVAYTSVNTACNQSAEVAELADAPA